MIEEMITDQETTPSSHTGLPPLSRKGRASIDVSSRRRQLLNELDEKTATAKALAAELQRLRSASFPSFIEESVGTLPRTQRRNNFA